MFRPLEAIFRLHEIGLEEKEYNIYSKHNGVSMLRSQHYTCWASALNLTAVCRGGRADGFYVAGWAETSCVRRDAVVWRYACGTSAWYSLFLHGLLVTLTVIPGVCLWGTGSSCVCGI